MNESFSIIRAGNGSHFDPEVVDAFFTIQDEILTIYKQYDNKKHQAFFDVPEMNDLLQRYNHEKLLKK